MTDSTEVAVPPRGMPAPASFNELQALAEFVSKSGLIPKDFQNKPENCLIAIQMGAEVGLPWAQALQSIAVINGRPSIWGDAALALVQRHPAFEWIDENESSADAGVCVIKRKGMPARRVEFTVEMARAAGLLNKDTYRQHQGRMLQRRARARCMADTFADALKGLALADDAHIIDVTPEPVERVQPIQSGKPATGNAAVKEKLDKKKNAEKPKAHVGPELQKVLDGYTSAINAADIAATDQLAVATLVDHEKQPARDARKKRVEELMRVDTETGEVKGE